MKITYDKEVDVLYIRFLETTVTTQFLENGVAIDYDTSGKIAGIEILDATERFGSENVFNSVSYEKLTTKK